MKFNNSGTYCSKFDFDTHIEIFKEIAVYVNNGCSNWKTEVFIATPWMVSSLGTTFEQINRYNRFLITE